MAFGERANHLKGLPERDDRAWCAMHEPACGILRAECTQRVARPNGGDGEIRSCGCGPGRGEGEVPHRPRHPSLEGRGTVRDALLGDDRARWQAGLELASSFPHRSRGYTAGRRLLLRASRRFAPDEWPFRAAAPAVRPRGAKAVQVALPAMEAGARPDPQGTSPAAV